MIFCVAVFSTLAERARAFPDAKSRLETMQRTYFQRLAEGNGPHLKGSQSSSAAMTGVNDSDAISMLLFLGEKECVLSVSAGRVLFNNYSREEANFEQAITLTLDARHGLHHDSTVSTGSTTVPIILSIPSTPRFELSSDEAALSTPLFECLLSSCSPRTYVIKFGPPEASESDFVWDNFQDQLVIHTRLSRLVVPLEAWKYEVPAHDRDKKLLFPVSLPNVRTPPLRRFTEIERNGDQQEHRRLSQAKNSEPTKSMSTSTLEDNNTQNSTDVIPKPRTQTPRPETLPPLSRPASGEQQSRTIASSSSDLTDKLPFSAVTAVQSQREANEVILKLRRRRTCRSSAKIPAVASPTSVADRELCPETVALDAKTKAELEDFNNLVTAARNHVSQQAVKAKSELAYYQQLLPTPPPTVLIVETPASALGSNTAALQPRKPRHVSAVARRPSKLPSLVRPSSGAAATTPSRANNQEASPLGHGPVRRKLSARQRLMSLSAVPDNIHLKEPSKLLSHGKLQKKSDNQLQQELDTDSELSDFDDPDPEVDDAPVMPDDLSGVATLEAGDPCF